MPEPAPWLGRLDAEPPRPVGVGQDHLDLLVVPADLTVRAAEGRSRTTVPFSALAVVRQL